jgi:hypothetical protein
VASIALKDANQVLVLEARDQAVHLSGELLLGDIELA